MSGDEKNSESQSGCDKKSRAQELLEAEFVKKWTSEQLESSKLLKLYDTEPWQKNRSVFNESSEMPSREEFQNEHLRYVAGMDISFVKDDDLACSGLFVFDLSDNMKIVYQDVDSQPITMKLPYVPGFLAYREAPFLLAKLENLRQTKPQFYPHCILIDGNGYLHQNGFGMACHIGLHSDTPAIGVSKKLFQVHGLENSPEHKARIKSELKKAGDYFELVDQTNQTGDRKLLGYCYRAVDNAPNPIYVSPGHKIGWETCLWVLSLVTKKYRIPEPIRHADILTREFIRSLNIDPMKRDS